MAAIAPISTRYLRLLCWVHYMGERLDTGVDRYMAHESKSAYNVPGNTIRSDESQHQCAANRGPHKSALIQSCY